MISVEITLFLNPISSKYYKNLWQIILQNICLAGDLPVIYNDDHSIHKLVQNNKKNLKHNFSNICLAGDLPVIYGTSAFEASISD